MQTTGKKQVKEQVLIAVLCTSICGVIQWGIDEGRQFVIDRRKAAKKKLKSSGEKI